ATEDLPPNLSSSLTFGVLVTEKNQPPTLAPIADQTILEAETVAFAASASDPDLPLQQLTFSLDPGAPGTASIDPNSGLFTWTALEDQGAATNQVTVRVTDDGPGNLSATQTFRIIVQPRFHVVISEIMHHPKAANAEYVELFNNSSNTTHDLSGLRLAGRNFSFTFLAGTTLAPRRLLCVAENLAAFNSAYGNGLPVTGPWNGALGLADTVNLVRPATGDQPEQVLETVTFESAAPWPAAANGSGASLQLIDAARDRNRVGNWSATTTYNGPRQLIVLTNEWRYYQLGPLSATNWRTAAFDDSLWPTGRALLYVESAALPAAKNTALTLGRLTYYFRTRFSLPFVPTGASLRIFSVLDDGMVVWLNGNAFYRLGMAEGDPAYDTLANRTVGDAALEGPFTLGTEYLVPGENVVAVEVHQINSTSSDIVFGLSLDLEGGTLAAFTPGATNNVVAPLPEFPTLRLNEVLARNSTGLADNAGDHDPWLELVNTGTNEVSLDGLFLTDAYTNLTKWAFPAGRSIPAGGWLIVFVDGEPGETTQTNLHTNFRLPATPDSRWTLALSRWQNGPPAVVDYLNGFVSAEDTALGRVPDGFPASDLQLLFPTPGAANQPPSANRPPALADLPDRTVIEGNLLAFTATASDPDAPPQTLEFSLGSGAPAGAGIDAVSGAFSWTPNSSQAPGTNRIVIRVSDNGTPPLSDEKAFVAVVIPAHFNLGDVRLTLEGFLLLAWPSWRGQTYRVECKDDLSEASWRILAEITADGDAASFTDPNLPARQRFYRVVLVP
ncbi:MAG: lamin tail domain-containing protein, partial [Chloroflexi bacterium]|nr:lamin tail domain-containing protein [Chloroflexota bacterium]